MLHIANLQNNSKLTGIKEIDIQPNAVDLRVANILGVGSGIFSVTEDEHGKELKQHRGSYPITTTNDRWFLQPGTYEIVMENNIYVGEGEAGWVITRSTLNRNGVFITSGLYDSGYNGVMAGSLHVTGGPFILSKGARVAQFLLFKSEVLKMYNGSYGIGSDHDKKYGV